ncbi:Bug family tripartite tricarboxylate transporter substrate binding protein [Plastoroseomonas arctica]|uniref:Tripartite tricarboxylate transporter substrate binding protein n=1 Tax=Plastoroseomonas arctica TaxID=1509237 RepID=A0AAF1JVE6_9PROT|nr:tripartite tricarboxylate transporter substrate-binding protein [Plastoroseomonas arctica]MBR0654304.1 tripartite tricarboxylate transporter substrate binding protein [Plastoroseomonas arctica]
MPASARLVAASLLSLLAAVLATAPASAQDAWPSRAIRFIVPFAPGGSNDFTARLMAPRMAARLGQQVVIETRPGAGGVTGVDIAAKAAPDGYTIALGTAGGIVIGPLMAARPPFDPTRDLAAVTLAINVQVPVAVPGASPYRTMRDLIDAARANPGRVTYGSSGTGGLPHLAGELIRIAAGVEMVHVPYRGGAPLALAVLTAEVNAGLSDLPVFMPHIASGQVRILAVGAPNRLRFLPDVPTLAETGIPNIDTNNWHGLVTAAGVPTAILDRLQAAAHAALSDPEAARLIAEQGMEAAPGSRADFTALIVREQNRWRGAIQSAGIRPE